MGRVGPSYLGWEESASEDQGYRAACLLGPSVSTRRVATHRRRRWERGLH